MATLKTTISLESSTLLASALKNTKVATETVNGGNSSFQQNQLPASQTEILFESNEASGSSGILYFYCEALSGNSAYGVDLTITNKSSNSAIFAKLLPNDVMYLPVYAGDGQGIMITATNTDPAATATINYFFGARD